MESDPYDTICLIVSNSVTPGISIGVILGILIMGLLLFISGLISGSEVAYFSLTPSNIDDLKENKTRLSKMVLNHLQMPERLLATILITNNFVNVAIVVISSYLTKSLFAFNAPEWLRFGIQVIAVAFLILFCSEIFPKIYANRFSVSFARLTAPLLNFVGRLFWPISYILIYSTSIVNKRLVKHNRSVSIDDLSDALKLTETQLNEEKVLLKGIVKFGNINVCDIMKSRVDTVAVDIHTNFHQLLKLINNSGYSRIPVYENNFDQIRGILYVKDLLPHLDKPNSFKWQSLIRPSYFVPESKKINDLLREFQSSRIHMAVVIDEYGGTSGIVTMEDVLEEIVGEIIDESDDDHLPYEKIDSHNYVFEGKILLNDFYKILGEDDNIFVDVKGDADTLAGLLLELRGEIPVKDDKISYKNYLFHVLAVDNRRIKKIKVTIKHNTQNVQGKEKIDS